MSAPHIRRATPRDTLDLAASIDAAYATYYNRIADLPDVSGGIAEDIETHHVLVAELSGRVIGGAVVMFEPGYAILANIAVHPTASGQGIAKSLIGDIENTCRESGCPMLRLSTHVDMPENVAFYRYLGWRVSGTTGNKIFMEKVLDC